MIHLLNCNIGGEGVPYKGCNVIPCLKYFPSIWPWPFPKYFRLKLIYGNTIWILIVAWNLLVVWSFHLVIVQVKKWFLVKCHSIILDLYGNSKSSESILFGTSSILVTSWSRYLFIVLSSSMCMVWLYILCLAHAFSCRNCNGNGW